MKHDIYAYPNTIRRHQTSEGTRKKIVAQRRLYRCNDHLETVIKMNRKLYVVNPHFLPESKVEWHVVEIHLHDRSKSCQLEDYGDRS